MRCIECGALVGVDSPHGRPFCVACDAALPRWRRADGCPRCGSWRTRPLEANAACPGCLSLGSALHRCHALLRYEGAIRRIVPAFKNPRGPFGPPSVVARAVASLALEHGHRISSEASGQLDLIVSVPLHPRRQRQRGFNHVDPIAREIARALRLPFRPRLLARVRQTQTQASLAAVSRRDNVRGAFRVAQAFEGDLRIGLVDDVLTTGHTLEAAADCLLEAGALEVRALSLAATLPRSILRRGSRAGSRSATYAPAAPGGASASSGGAPGRDPVADVDRSIPHPEPPRLRSQESRCP